jgi:hypothetical protein
MLSFRNNNNKFHIFQDIFLQKPIFLFPHSYKPVDRPLVLKPVADCNNVQLYRYSKYCCVDGNLLIE